MREKNRKTIEIEKMLPQFTTMNVIDGQAGLMSYSSLIFYSLTIDNILNKMKQFCKNHLYKKNKYDITIL